MVGDRWPVSVATHTSCGSVHIYQLKSADGIHNQQSMNLPLGLVHFLCNIGTVSITNVSKLNRLLALLPSGIVATSAWLVQQGYSLELQRRYRSSRWFESIGHGAMIRTGDTVDWLGGVHALQAQLGLSFHPAAGTALAMQGRAHFLSLSPRRAWLLGGADERLPRWFRDFDWGVSVEVGKTGFLPSRLGLFSVEHKGLEVQVSGVARAMMECLYLAPRHQSLEEAAELMDGLNNVRPRQVQELLEACTSIKVKRLFLYLAERSGHDWVAAIDRSKIDLGRGKRSLVPSGVYVPAYRMTVPASLERRDA